MSINSPATSSVIQNELAEIEAQIISGIEDRALKCGVNDNGCAKKILTNYVIGLCNSAIKVTGRIINER